MHLLLLSELVNSTSRLLFLKVLAVLLLVISTDLDRNDRKRATSTVGDRCHLVKWELDMQRYLFFTCLGSCCCTLFDLLIAYCHIMFCLSGFCWSKDARGKSYQCSLGRLTQYT